MKIVNRIIFIFFTLAAIVLYGAWRFVHSEKFSKIASKKVSEVLHKKASIDLEFSKVEVGIFPPRTIFHRVQLEKNDHKDLDFNIVADKLEIIFSYSDLLVSEFEIDRVVVKQGKVNVKTYSNDERGIDWKKISTEEVYLKYRAILNQMPFRLNGIEMVNVNAVIDDSSFYAKSLLVVLNKLSLRAKGSVEKVVVTSDLKNLGNKIELNSVNFLLNFNKNKWSIDQIKIYGNKFEEIEMSAELENQNSKQGLYVSGSGKIKLELQDLMTNLKKFVPDISNELMGLKGQLESDFKMSSELVDPIVILNGKIKNAESQWINAGSVAFEIKKENQILYLENLEVKNGLERYLLIKGSHFLNLKTAKFTDFHFKLALENAHTNTFLFAIKDSLEVFKASVTGEVAVKLFDDKAVFELNNNLHFLNFGLAEKNSKKFIFKNSGFSLSQGNISIQEDMSVHLDFLIQMPGTELKTKGIIAKDRIDIGFKDSKLDLTSLGPISGVSLTGKGKTEGEISGPMDNVVFKLNVNWNDFSVIDLNLGRVESNFTFSLNDLKINFEKLKGKYNRTDYELNGGIGFQNGGDLNLDISFLNGTYTDLEKILYLALKNVKPPIPLDFDLKSNMKISGGFDLDKLRIDGNVTSEGVKFGTEEAESLDFQLSLAKSQLNFRNIKLAKSRGQVEARFHVNLENSFMDFTGNAKNLRLRDFNYYRDTNLKYDGDLSLEFDGSGLPEDFNSRFKCKINNAFIDNIPASSSEINLYANTKETILSLNLLGGKVKSDSLISLKNNLAAVKSSIETNDPKEILGVFSGHNMGDKKLTGNIKLKSQVHLALEPFSVKRFVLNIDQFNLKKEAINVVVDSKRNKIDVNDGMVKVWNLKFSDGNEFFSSVGKNNDNGSIAVENKFSLKASLLEMLSEDIYRATGVIKGNNEIAIGPKIVVEHFNLYGIDHSIKLKKVPGPISHLDFMIVKNNEDFEVSNMVGKYGGGEFKASGKVKLQGLFPQVDLNYQIDKATIPILKRSNVIISANGSFKGNAMPYRLDGKVNILHGELLDDPSELTKDDKVNVEGYKKYLPEKIYSKNKELFDLNVSFNTTAPLAIKNNLAEIYVKGNGTLKGDLLDPELFVRLEVVPSVSKFKFKGHDFYLSQGSFDVRDQGKNRTSDLKITGTTKISDYDVKLDISGNISKVNVDLSSEPALSKDDLLSLLALGVTQDISKGLGANERSSVTTVGLGTLLVDQLKINEDLNTALGLKLSVMPEFKQDETTLIQSKSAVSDGGGGRLKSATKIKVNKELSKKVDFSLSSTLGGSMEPKQEMNLNYKFNKNFSLEGIYEVKPAEDDNTDNPNSMGLDLKWRKSF